MDEPLMLPTWVVEMVGRLTLENEQLRRHVEVLSHVHTEPPADA